MKNALEVCDHEFEVRTVSTVVFLQTHSAVWVQARKRSRLKSNQGWFVGFFFPKMSTIMRGTVEPKVYARGLRMTSHGL